MDGAEPSRDVEVLTHRRVAHHRAEPLRLLAKGSARAERVGEPVPAPQDMMQKVRLLSDIPENERPKVRVIDPKGPWFAAETNRLRVLKGADFSVCDIDLPVEVR